MVHALHRAHRMVKPAGLVVEIHPTPETAVILVDDARAGWVDSAGGSARHQAAEDALALALRDGLYRRDDATEFDFDTYGDSIEELRDFNIFALAVGIIGQILNRASWIGNDTSNCGRTPHEQ